jgi:sulfatase maturation enzyme AslB (radical SAM superfamily)
MFAFTKFLRLREKDGRVAIFHELHPVPIYCSAEEWKSFSADVPVESRLAKGFLDRGLLVASPADDVAEFIRVAERLKKKLSRPNILYLMLAQGCNFACGYCPIPRLAAQYGENLLSPEDARAGLRLWSEHLRDANDESRETYIIFYGGEPLLNKQTLVSALEDIREMQAASQLPLHSMRLMLATNGTLFDNETIRLCQEHGILVAIGLDGARSACNRHRLYTDGRESFEDVVSTIRKLVSCGIRTVVSATIIPENFGEIEPLACFLKGLGVEKFGFNFLKGRALADLVPVSECGRYECRAASTLTSDLRASKEDGYEYQLEKKVDAYRRQDFFPVDCTCYGNQLVIQPDGQISNCPFFRADLGHVGTVGADFRIANVPIIAEWRKRLPIFHEAFRDMDSKALYGPGCAWGAYDLTGDFLAVDTALTEFSK